MEVVDLVLKLREKLVRSHLAFSCPLLPAQKYVHPLPPLSLQVRAQGHQLPVKEVTLQRAQLYIDTVIGSLPKDLQAVLCPP